MKKILHIVFVASLLISCSNSTERAPIFFKSLDAATTGINFSNTLIPNGDLNIIEYLYYYNGAGVGIGDINNDGFDDVFLTGNQSPDKLYLNQGGMKFKDITSSAGIDDSKGWSNGVTLADVNNDGFIDVFVSKVSGYQGLEGHHLLYLNNGDETFTESASQVGLDFKGFGTQASFFDYDKDGDLDVYLLNHTIHTPRNYGSSNVRKNTDDKAGDRLLENKLESGQLVFEDVTEQAGIYSSSLGYGLGLSTIDINEDGNVDIYVGNDFHENDYIYLNQGDKTFKEVSKSYFGHTSRYTMGLDAADMNNDGKVDIFSLDMMPNDADIFMKSGGEDSDKVSQIKESYGYNPQFSRNHFQLNNGNGAFRDVALITNTHATDWSWSVLLEDYDNDGLSDIFISNGIYRRPNDLDFINYESDLNFDKLDKKQQDELELQFVDMMPTLKISNVVFRNSGDLTFDRYTKEAGLSESYSNGAAYSDLDNDGDLDIIINNIDSPVTVLENQSNASNAYLNIRLNNPNGAELGTKVYAHSGGKTWFRELTATRGFESSSSQQLHFGLGANTQIDSLKVVWLDGKEQRLTNVATNQKITINNENTSNFIANSKPSSNYSIEEFPFLHIENHFLDYEKEPLMPERLSIEGPAYAKADFNGDGLDDLYLGGAEYQAASLFIQNPDKTFSKKILELFTADAIYEDVDATAFDFDNDGDMDLYVTSGGNEYVEGDMHFTDRMYINNGKAEFMSYPSQLPAYNGGSVSAADFDGDGFDDLFIGSRSVPSGYGLSPFGFILKNTQKANFQSIAQARMGMITDSEWADLNGDGLLDLIYVGDWMPITVLINSKEGTFHNKTVEYGLENTSGLWNCVSVGDVNKDGKLDIIAGNTGLNFKWKASVEHPVTIYLDDFDENTYLDPIIFYNFFGENVPFASKDKLTAQIPALKKYFVRYDDFAKAKSIKVLTGKEEVMQTKDIKELRSMLFINRNNESFVGTPLPIEAQMSSVEDIYLDGGDLYYVGNYSGYVTELGPSVENSGGVFSNFKNGNFTSHEFLPLPTPFEGRVIDKLEENKYLVLSNNDRAYIINKINN